MKSSTLAKATKKTALETVKTSTSRAVEQALLALENACMQILDSQFIHDRDDVEGLVWQRKFKNIVTPISLALREYKGPRRFHNHYKHREDDDAVLHPVLEDPMEMLSHVCSSALTECQNGFGGLRDPEISANRDILELALRKFMTCYRNDK